MRRFRTEDGIVKRNRRKFIARNYLLFVRLLHTPHFNTLSRIQGIFYKLQFPLGFSYRFAGQAFVRTYVRYGLSWNSVYKRIVNEMHRWTAPAYRTRCYLASDPTRIARPDKSTLPITNVIAANRFIRNRMTGGRE